jgi:transcriptional regulator GlxA family with amidase domain
MSETTRTGRERRDPPASSAETTRRFVFMLAPQFSMIAFAAAIEPLRTNRSVN